VFCIGGGELYRAALPFATTLHMTEIARAFEGDARFPPIDRGEWRETRARIARPPSRRIRVFVRHVRAQRAKVSLHRDPSYSSARSSRMSHDHFHVHGPHDHEIEHAAHSGDPLAAASR
jgi:dihydrofolate reductase